MGVQARSGAAAFLLFAAVLSPSAALAQRTPQPIFTELFPYDPGNASELLGKWRISSQLDSKLRPRLDFEEGAGVARLPILEGILLDLVDHGAAELVSGDRNVLRPVSSNLEGEAVPNEFTEFHQLASAGGAIGSDLDLSPFAGHDAASRFHRRRARALAVADVVPGLPHRLVRASRPIALLHGDAADHLADRVLDDADPQRPLGEHVRFFAQVTAGSSCDRPPMTRRVQICQRDLPRESWATVHVRLNPAHDASGQVDIWLNGSLCGSYQGPMADRDYGVRRNGTPFINAQPPLRHIS